MTSVGPCDHTRGYTWICLAMLVWLRGSFFWCLHILHLVKYFPYGGTTEGGHVCYHSTLLKTLSLLRSFLKLPKLVGVEHRGQSFLHGKSSLSTAFPKMILLSFGLWCCRIWSILHLKDPAPSSCCRIHRLSMLWILPSFPLLSISCHSCHAVLHQYHSTSSYLPTWR